MNTSCLIALSNLGLLGILCSVFKEVIIPKGVSQEFGEEIQFDCVRVVDVNSSMIDFLHSESNLGLGESEVIAFSYDAHDTAVIDDLKARKIARSLNVKVIGTLAILIEAERKELIKSAFQSAKKLKELGFRISDKVLQLIQDK